MTRLVVATVTANGMVLTDYVNALLAMLGRLQAAGIAASYRTVDGPNHAIQRDMLAHEFLRSHATHLLFVDGDLSFPAALCQRLLSADKPLIGAPYPRKPVDLTTLDAGLGSKPFDIAFALATRWQVEPLGGTVRLKNGFCRVAALGAGFLLVRRDCLERLAAEAEVPRYAPFGGGGPVRAFFRDLEGLGAGGLDPGFVFCRRWAAIGGEVWADAEAEMRHVGEMAYGMPLTRHLQALARRRAARSAPVAPAPAT